MMKDSAGVERSSESWRDHETDEKQPHVVSPDDDQKAEVRTCS